MSLAPKTLRQIGALSLPCHRPGDAPAGLMLAGLRGRDRQVLELGLAVEQALAQ